MCIMNIYHPRNTRHSLLMHLRNVITHWRVFRKLRAWRGEKLRQASYFLCNPSLTHAFQAPDGSWLVYCAEPVLYASVDSVIANMIEALQAEDETDALEKLATVAATIDARKLEQLQRACDELNAFFIKHTETIPTQDELIAERNHLRKLTFDVCITNACNMACEYCYARGAHSASTPQRMPAEVAGATIEFILNQLQPATQMLNIGISPLGEPLLALDASVGFINELEMRIPQNVKLCYGFATNAIAVSEAMIERLAKLDALWLLVSIDGPREIHDELRRAKDGGGSYQRTLSGVNVLLKNFNDGTDDVCALATLTPTYPEPRKVLEHLLSIGFKRVGIKPVRATMPEHKHTITHDNVSAILTGYRELCEFIIEQTLIGNYRYLKAVYHQEDMLGRMLMRIHERSRHFYRCPAGKAQFCISTDGGIYPCHNFSAMNRMRMGDVWHGIDEKVAMHLWMLNVDAISKCKSCWARYLCGGPCYAESVAVNGDIAQPIQARCELIRGIIELAIWVHNVTCHHMLAILNH